MPDMARTAGGYHIESYASDSDRKRERAAGVGALTGRRTGGGGCLRIRQSLDEDRVIRRRKVESEALIPRLDERRCVIIWDP